MRITLCLHTVANSFAILPAACEHATLPFLSSSASPYAKNRLPLPPDEQALPCACIEILLWQCMCEYADTMVIDAATPGVLRQGAFRRRRLCNISIQLFPRLISIFKVCHG